MIFQNIYLAINKLHTYFFTTYIIKEKDIKIHKIRLNIKMFTN